MGKFGSFAVSQVIGLPYGISYEVVGRNEVRPASKEMISLGKGVCSCQSRLIMKSNFASFFFQITKRKIPKTIKAFKIQKTLRNLVTRKLKN